MPGEDSHELPEHESEIVSIPPLATVPGTTDSDADGGGVVAVYVSVVCPVLMSRGPVGLDGSV